MYDAVFRRRLSLLRLCLKYNYGFDRPIAFASRSACAQTAVSWCLAEKQYDVLRLLADVGYVIYDALSVEEPVPTANGCVARSAVLDSEICCVRRLKQLCRKTLRKAIGFQIHHKVSRLPLPVTLKSYLLLDDMDLHVESS